MAFFFRISPKAVVANLWHTRQQVIYITESSRRFTITAKAASPHRTEVYSFNVVKLYGGKEKIEG